LIYADGINLLGDSINTIEENTVTILEASRDVSVEINAEKTEYMIMSHHPNSGQNQNIRTANESFENVVKFELFATTLTNQNDIHDEIKSRLNSRMFAIIQSKIFCLPFSYQKNLKTKIYKTVILTVVLCGHETWSLTLREESRLRVSENRVLRRIFGPKSEGDGSCRKFHNDELYRLYSSSNVVRVIKSRRMRWTGHVARMGEERGLYRVWAGRPEGRRPLERPSRRWEDNVKLDLSEKGIDGTNWLRIGSSGGLL
jgi:hypothetical protein